MVCVFARYSGLRETTLVCASIHYPLFGSPFPSLSLQLIHPLQTSSVNSLVELFILLSRLFTVFASIGNSLSYPFILSLVSKYLSILSSIHRSLYSFILYCSNPFKLEFQYFPRYFYLSIQLSIHEISS